MRQQIINTLSFVVEVIINKQLASSTCYRCSPDISRILLEFVVPPGSPAVAGFYNQTSYVRLALCLCHVKLEPVSQFRENSVATPKAWQVYSRDHGHLYKRYDLFGMLTESHEAFDHQ